MHDLLFFCIKTTSIERRFVPVPGVPVPGVPVPGVPVPGVPVPGVAVPGVPVPGVPVPGVPVPGVPVPGVAVPGVPVPGVPVPGVPVPGVPVPGVPVPGVPVPGVPVPGVPVPGVAATRAILSDIDDSQHFIPRDFTHDFQFISARLVTFCSYITISNDFCNLVFTVETVIIETVGSSLTEVHTMTANIKFPFFLKFSGASVLFSVTIR